MSGMASSIFNIQDDIPTNGKARDAIQELSNRQNASASWMRTEQIKE
jgi:hypothetical protein